MVWPHASVGGMGGVLLVPMLLDGGRRCSLRCFCGEQGLEAFARAISILNYAVCIYTQGIQGVETGADCAQLQPLPMVAFPVQRLRILLHPL